MIREQGRVPSYGPGHTESARRGGIAMVRRDAPRNGSLSLVCPFPFCPLAVLLLFLYKYTDNDA
jgi:hypothetical protein